MEIGNQIKALRLRKGVTQETLAQHFGVSSQAVSKWERGAATPDIELLPQLSAYFGVSIDELFALSDDTRMERIQNMIWDVRYFDPETVENERLFLLEKASREPENGRPYELLAEIENHLAKEHNGKAAEYAKEALSRDPTLREAHSELVEASRGKCSDWSAANHRELIDFYKGYIDEHPDCWRGILWLMDQLMDDYRFDEAEAYCDRLEKIKGGYRVPLYRGLIRWYRGERTAAYEIWEQMKGDYPDEWLVWFSVADQLARSGEYEAAKANYRKGYEIAKPPRYADSLESIAQICEIQGDIPGAIAAWQEELELFEKEWNFTTGETADVVRREIARLEKKLKK